MAKITGENLHETDKQLIVDFGDRHNIPNLMESWIKATQTGESQVVDTLEVNGKLVEQLKVGGGAHLNADEDRLHMTLRFEFERLEPRTDVSPLLWVSFMMTSHMDPTTREVIKHGMLELFTYNVLRDDRNGRVIMPVSGLETVRNLVSTLRDEGQLSCDDIVHLPRDMPLRTQP